MIARPPFIFDSSSNAYNPGVDAGGIMSVRSAASMAIIVSAAVVHLGADQKIQMKDLPPAVQKAIQDQTAGAQVKGLSKEVEGGKTFYEAETVVNGRTRDLLFDA